MEKLKQSRNDTLKVIYAANEETSQVAYLSKSINLSFGENEANIMQKLMEIEIFEAKGKHVAS